MSRCRKAALPSARRPRPSLPPSVPSRRTDRGLQLSVSFPVGRRHRQPRLFHHEVASKFQELIPGALPELRIDRDLVEVIRLAMPGDRLADGKAMPLEGIAEVGAASPVLEMDPRIISAPASIIEGQIVERSDRRIR